MLKRSIFSRIFVLVILISLIVGFFILIVTIKQRTQDLEKALVQENKLLAETISTTIETTYLTHTLPFIVLKKVAETEDIIFLWIVKPNGEIFYANDPKMFGRIIKDSSLAAKELVIKNSISPKDGKKIKLIVSPLKMKIRGTPWSFYMGVSLKRVSDIQRRIISTGFVFFAVVIIVILLTSFYLAKKITNPLEILRKGAEIIGKGNLDYRIKLKTGDEIEGLAESFNQMAEKLEESHTALKESKAILEIKVKARTKELEELTQRLEEKVKERTREIQEKLRELERFHRLAVGRELKMIELKKEIKELRKEIKDIKT